MSDESLVVVGLRAGYGKMQVVGDVDLELRPGEVVVLLGRNGAGKSTTLGAIGGDRTGWSRGVVQLNGSSINGLSASKIARAGVALVPEGRRIFREMSVFENLQIGAYLRRGHPKSEFADDVERVSELFPALALYARKVAGALSGGEQQMVAIGQALMARPRYLLLDEPTAGLSPALAEQLYDAIVVLAKSGLGVLVVEQSVDRALRHSHRTYVMETGEIVLDGKSSVFAESDIVDRIVTGVTNYPQAGDER